jgi:hypothetical protein
MPICIEFKTGKVVAVGDIGFGQCSLTYADGRLFSLPLALSRQINLPAAVNAYRRSPSTAGVRWLSQRMPPDSLTAGPNAISPPKA